MRNPGLALTVVFGSFAVAALAADWLQYRGPHLTAVRRKGPPQKMAGEAPATLEKTTPAWFSSFAVAGGKAFTLEQRYLDALPGSLPRAGCEYR